MHILYYDYLNNIKTINDLKNLIIYINDYCIPDKSETSIIYKKLPFISTKHNKWISKKFPFINCLIEIDIIVYNYNLINIYIRNYYIRNLITRYPSFIWWPSNWDLINSYSHIGAYTFKISRNLYYIDV